MVKNRLTSLLVVALALGISASSLFAQNQGGGQGGGRGGRGGFGGGMGGGFQRDVLSLVSNEAVVKDLGLSDEVAAKLKKVSDDYRAELRKGFGDGPFNRDASETERAERAKKMADATKTARDANLPKVKEILTPAQFERVQQIAWQANGVSAYSDPEVVKALALTQEQQDKIAAANKDYREKSSGIGRDEGAREKRAALTKERDTQVAAVLTADQAAKWTTLKGKEFDTTKLGGFGGGRGGQGGGNGGGQGGNRGNRGANGRPATE